MRQHRGRAGVRGDRVIEAGLGLVVGIVIGSLGGGGGIVTVPVLVYLLSMEPVVATTASLVIVGIASLASLAAHARHGVVRWRAGLVFGVLGLAGTWAGSTAARLVDPQRLLVAFGMLLLTVAVLMLRSSARPGPSQEPADGTHPDAPTAPNASGVHGPPRGHRVARRSVHSHRGWALVGTATGVGLLTGFFGVGGGFVVVPALVLLLRLPMAGAVGTSLLVVTVNSGTALATRLAHGVALDWPVVWLFTAGAVAGGLVGAAFSRRLPDRALSRAFAVLLVLVAAVTLARSGAAIAG